MNYDTLKKKINETAIGIIDMQYADNKKHGIRNHFLLNVINEIVLIESAKIKKAIDDVLSIVTKDNIKEYSDDHHLDFELLINTEMKSAFYIEDDSSYGPDMNAILVIDNKDKGRLYIRRISNRKHLKKYIDSDFEINNESFVESDFIFTLEYISEFTRNILKHVTSEESKIKLIEKSRKIEDMGDRTFELYEKTEYSTSLIFSLLNSLKEN